MADSVIYYRMEIRSAEDFKLTAYLLVHPKSLDVPDVEALKEILRQATFAIHTEDIAACEGVTKGLHSRTAMPARLSRLEAAIHQHQIWLLDQMARV